MQEVQGYCQDCCAGAGALHASSVVMRDFRSPNVLTCNGAEGKYVIVDLEFAGPSKHPWTLDRLQGWDNDTLNQVKPHMASCNAMYWLQKVFQYVNSLRTSAICACYAYPCTCNTVTLQEGQYGYFLRHVPNWQDDRRAAILEKRCPTPSANVICEWAEVKATVCFRSFATHLDYRPLLDRSCFAC